MIKNIRILSIAWSLPGGGVSHYIASINKLKNFKGIIFFQVVIRAPGWHVHNKLWNQIGPLEIIIKNRADFRWLPKLLKLIKEKQINILMVHDFNGFIIGGISRIFGLKIPILATYHVPYIPSTFSRRCISLLINEFGVLFLKFIAQRVITVSGKYRRILIKRGVDHKKIATIHNGIKNDQLVKNKSIYYAEEGIPDGDLIFGTTSRLHPQKGIKYLLDAIPKVLNQFKNIQFVLFGTGPLESSLKNQCVRLGIEKRVHFLGFKDNISEWLNGMDVFILPSLAEGHSIGLLEAMRAALPIICTPVGDNLETIKHDIDGLIVPERNSEALSEAILILAKNPEMRKSLGYSAKKKFVNFFTEEKMINKTFKIINELEPSRYDWQ